VKKDPASQEYHGLDKNQTGLEKSQDHCFPFALESGKALKKEKTPQEYEKRNCGKA